MTIRPPDTGQGSAFAFIPSTAVPYSLRNYEPESLEDLEPVYAHVDALLEQYKNLVPGGLLRSLLTWRTDLWTAIEAKHDEEADEDPAE
jgi:hypothetical protein